ncbi:carbon-nitrogen hydrolase family protein [Salipiger bermudensis]|uniref:carbon-nitrogen hydrolase family protein n=1 Tax=Salipiger bermudensis TaxID=344736 RepID=UPI001CD5CB2D|nr:carbon-nitrogen hydrolase family protein [Salipiger bermudensis]MCA0964772.1 carbon-nitrogen hydrolase family protein [Salipiger bermudensis]
MKIAMLQMNSRDNKLRNLDTIEALFRTHITPGEVDLVVAPEYATFLGGSREAQWAAAEILPDGEAYRALQSLARSYRTTFHAGSMLEAAGGRYYNTSVTFGPDGTEIARYRKIHLFDVETPSGHVFSESDVIDRGDTVTSYSLAGRRAGSAICYDLRFAELFLAHMRAGCDLIVLPAAFNMETGKDHWECMLRTRAIETQCYVIAPAQVGAHAEPAGERACYGNSMVIDPWGAVIARASAQPGVTFAELDFDYLDRVRSTLPSNTHHVMA